MVLILLQGSYSRVRMKARPPLSLKPLVDFLIESEKSTTQKITDSGSNLMGQAGETLGNAANTVKDSLGMGEQSKHFQYWLVSSTT